MNKSLLSGAFAILAFASGCGSNTSGAPVAATGNWSFLATASVATNHHFPFEIDGQLNGTNGKVAGILLVPAPACFVPTGNAPRLPTYAVTGSEKGGATTLTSDQVDAQTLTIKGTFSADGNTFSGTYSVAGGCDDKDSGTLAGTRIPSLTGTFDGPTILKAAPPGTATENVIVSTALLQSATPTDFAVTFSGIIGITGSSCFTTGTATAPSGSVQTIPPSLGGVVYGGNYSVIYNMNDGSQLEAFGTVDAAGKTLTNNFLVSGGHCNGATSASAALTRQ